MNMKKNLTLAGLVALLGVPALNSTQHIPSVTAHAESTAQLERDAGSTFNELNKEISENGGHSVRRSDEVDPGNGTIYNGNNIQSYQDGTYVNGQRVSNAQALALFNKQDDNTYGSNSNNNSNDSTQYASRNSLPQTGENNNGSKAIAAGIASATMGLGLAAFDMAKKHRKDSTKGVYDSIMGNTFTSLGKNLK